MVTPGDRLCGLKVGKAGHHPIRTRLGLPQKGRLQGGQASNRTVGLIAHPKAKIDGHLIIARTARMQAASGLSDQVFQAGLDIHMDVFQRRGKFERAAFDL